MDVLAVVDLKSPKHRKYIAAVNDYGKQHNVRVLKIDDPEDARELIKSEIANNPDLVICIGRLVVYSALVEYIIQKSTQRPMVAVFSGGLDNDFCKTFETKSIRKVLTEMDQCEVVEASVTKLKMNGVCRYAVNMFTCGIGAKVVKNARSKSNLPDWLAYFLSILQVLSGYKAPKIRTAIDDMLLTNRFWLIAIGQGIFAGNSLGLLPQSRLNSERSAVTLMTKPRIRDFIRHLFDLYRAKKITTDPRIVYTKAGSVEVSPLDGVLEIEGDGRIFVKLEPGRKAIFTTQPKALKLLK
ncbi:MAG: hypothetical protein Kow0075_06920 [Salibacteraceae bacterium]